ncbi:hypothetical protein CHS0354_041698 [Potamilus streckersoni]|uniref:Ketimine reductase mu-crystallin n=1 Tax=Potamilus streckersoni TaxID=2493646 RepID=A0AAE0W4I5_9BIVA|nr:hypothetical protein CHS0354_041698 [Potamilus streckersoni]
MAEDSIPYLSGAKIKEVLDYNELISVMKKAFAKYSSGKVVQPVRTVVKVEKADGFLGLMPALCEDEDVLATKLVTLYRHNQEKYGLPTHNAIVVVFSVNTGIPKVIMDGEVITTMRTAAASAVASKYLCAPNPRKLAILGSGVQARSHFEALSSLYKFEQVTVWSRTFNNAEHLAGEINATPCNTAEEAVKDADIIVTVTLSSKPVVQKAWVKPGCHINAVGACRPDWHEIDPELMRSAIVYVDSRAGAEKESGDIILSKAEVYAELGEVILGTKNSNKDKTTVFKSLGMAIEDVLSAKLVCDLLLKTEKLK